MMKNEKFKVRIRQHGITTIFMIRANDRAEAIDKGVEFYEDNSDVFVRHCETNYEVKAFGMRKGGPYIFGRDIK